MVVCAGKVVHRKQQQQLFESGGFTAHEIQLALQVYEHLWQLSSWEV